MITRKLYLDNLISFRDKQLIKVITGIRRCGKSTLLELYQEYLISVGVDPGQIIFINLEDKDYEHLLDSTRLYNYIKDRLIEGKNTYILIDEVQSCKGFQSAVDGLFVKKNVDIYITGSNAYMLSGELATLLSGRYVEIEMLPLSFAEYVEARGDENSLEKKFRDYLRFGSFPYTLQFNNNEKQINLYLKSIYDTVFIKDVVTRSKVQDVMVLESLIKFLFDNIGNVCSTKKISDTLTSNGRKTNTHTIESYLEALKNSYIIYEAKRYDIKGKQYLKSLEKYYIVDTGLRNMLLGYKDIDAGHILENVVYLELLRRGYQVYIGKIDAREVDFVAISQTETLYIQVAESVKDKSTLERELQSLNNIKDHYTKLLITNDYDINASYNGIKSVNIIDWLLGK